MVGDNQEQSLKPLVTTNLAVQPVASFTPRTRNQKQITETEDALLVSLEEHMLNLQQQVLDRIRPSADRKMEAFVYWVRCSILEFDHSLWRRCQQEISTTIYKYIGENDLLKRKQPQEPSQYR
ncbi:hypothetical protein DPMN_140932 [Dreissena polymorpha]|uniref:Uncharacterized protein n=1 Tax=Dreissena polymorpha TaxID=45954 RepID=A0A9D4JM60_DREPO|nr:hypothetical protein DPMN_140932 [Dreissena polymorpha]